MSSVQARLPLLHFSFIVLINEPLAKLALAAFWPFCQSSAFDANPLLLRVGGFASNADLGENGSKISSAGVLQKAPYFNAEAQRGHFQD